MEEPELIESPLSSETVIDGHRFEVQIYCTERDAWFLEEVDERNASTVWEGTFPTDAAAFKEFQEFLAEHGPRGILDMDPIDASNSRDRA